MSKFKVGQRVRYKDEPLIIDSHYVLDHYSCRPWFDTGSEYISYYREADLVSEEEYREVYGELYGQNDPRLAYQRFVNSKLLETSEPIDYCLAGLVEEVGEVARLVRKMHQGKGAVTKESMCDEMGDVLYYFTALLSNCDLTLEQVMDYNVEKLTKKHGE